MALTNSDCDQNGRTKDTTADKQFRKCSKEFGRRYPTEKSCWDELVKHSDALGLLGCNRCGAYNSRRKTMRIFICRDCGSQKSVSSRTVFERVRGLRPYFAAIWFLEHGVPINSVQLAKFAELSQSSALNVLRKLRLVVESKIGKDVQPLLSLSFSDTMIRRSFETPARQHPSSEEDEHHITPSSAAASSAGPSAPAAAPATMFTAFSPPAHGKTSADYPDLTDDEKALFDILTQGSKSFEKLIALTGLTPNALASALTTLEIEGLAIEKGGNYELTPEPGENTVRNTATGQFQTPPNLNRRHDIISMVNYQSEARTHGFALVSASLINLQKIVHDFIVDNFNGVSRKYLQLYMSDYWCNWDRERWKQASLIIEGLLCKPIVYSEMMKFVTAPLVRVPTALAA